jgi:hypothetical protein
VAGGGVSAVWGDAETASAKAQSGDAPVFEVFSVNGELAWACDVIAMNSPTETTSINSTPKRFKEMYRMEPPRFQLVCEGQQRKNPAYCDKSHIDSIPEYAYGAIKLRPDLPPCRHLSFS